MQWFEDEVRALEQRLRGTPAGRLVFYGSSTIRLWPDLAKDFPGAINAGFGGSTLNACAWFYDRLVVPLRPRHLVLYVGDNDVGDGAGLELFHQRLRDLFNTIDHFHPGLPITWLTIKPSPSRAALLPHIQLANDLARGLLVVRGRSVVVEVCRPLLDQASQPIPALFQADGLHLSAAGYAALRAALWQHLPWLREHG
ncbi:hypothetical protein LBMAG53_28480 [Planctomycetota bacterium]|nr:hypothetical protein LBMAG53_28480 [Planctomycetota bacterium]